MLADGTNTYAYGLGRIGEQQPGGMAYHLADPLGSVRQLVNAAGSVTLARSYDPFGQPLASAGPGASMYGYTGEQTDASGNVFLRARYYVPGMARFLTRDAYRGDLAQPLTLNRWAYANGNPINMVDPSGHFAIAAAAAACIASAVCAVTVVAAVTVLAVYTAWWLSQPENQAALRGVAGICETAWNNAWDNIFGIVADPPAPDRTVQVPVTPPGGGQGAPGGPGWPTWLTGIGLAVLIIANTVTGSGPVQSISEGDYYQPRLPLDIYEDGEGEFIFYYSELGAYQGRTYDEIAADAHPHRFVLGVGDALENLQRQIKTQNRNFIMGFSFELERAIHYARANMLLEIQPQSQVENAADLYLAGHWTVKYIQTKWAETVMSSRTADDVIAGAHLYPSGTFLLETTKLSGDALIKLQEAGGRPLPSMGP